MSTSKGKEKVNMTTAAAKTVETPNVPENIIQVPLKDIHADYAWNVRSQAEVYRDTSDGVRDGKNDEGFGLREFAKTFNLGGQDTPVILAEVKSGKTLAGVKTDKKFELIAGFRRFTAISLLNSTEEVDKRKAGPTETNPNVGPVKSVANVADGHIKAIVKSFPNALAARQLNARENTLRSNLGTADLVRLVKEYVQVHEQTQPATAETLGITQGYVAKLNKIGKLPDVILAHWRERTPIPGVDTKADWKQLTNADMLDLAEVVGKEPQPELVKRYVALLEGGKPATGDGKTTEQKVEEKLDDMGFLLGALFAKGIIAKGTMAFGEVIGPQKAGYLLNGGAKDPTPAKRDELVETILEAWERGAKKFARKSRKAEETVDEAE